MTSSAQSLVAEAELDLHVRVGKVWGEGVVFNSPGPNKSLPETEWVLETAAPMATFGSVTIMKRMGNALPNYFQDGPGVHTQNAIGLTNLGLAHYLPDLPRVAEKANEVGKHLIVSIAADDEAEFLEMVKDLVGLNVSIEFNLSCPNIDRGGEMWAFEPDQVLRLLAKVRRIFQGNVIIKLNYHPMMSFNLKFAEALNREGTVDAVALINTVGNTLIIDPEKLGRPVISRDSGGLSGSSILPIALGTIFIWREALDPQIDIIGEGGINSGADIMCMFSAGASVCRVGSAYARRGRKVFTELTMQFVEEMRRHGYTSLSQIPRMRLIEPLPSWQPA